MQYVKDIEVEYNVDVLVVGGGPSGVAAAWSAAQKGVLHRRFHIHGH